MSICKKTMHPAAIGPATGLFFLAVSIAAVGQEPPAASGPAGADEPGLCYRVHEVRGKVRVGAIGLDPKLDEGWTRVRPNDRIVAGQQLHVPFRGRIKMVAEPSTPPTVILFEQATLVAIRELYLKEGVAHSRIGLGYGAIRAGVAEGEIRSDMEIDCPVATLSKKGTDIFRIWYGDRDFTMSLSDMGRGQIQAIQNQYGAAMAALVGGLQRTRFINPGQFMTQQMARTIDVTQFDRQINVNDFFGLKDGDLMFSMLHGQGLGVLLPGGNPIDLLNPAGSHRQPQDVMIGEPADRLPIDGGTTGNAALRDAVMRLGPRVIERPDGHFGIGQGIVPGITKSVTQQLQRMIHPPPAPLNGPACYK